METRRNTTAGVPLWTPAPVRSSPTGTDTSDNVWEGEEEEEEEEGEEGEDDFASQMDENGIIGLSEALENEESGETPVDGDVCSFSRGCVQETPLQEMSFSRDKSLREELPKPSSCDNTKNCFESWTGDEDVRQGTKQQRTEQLDMTDEEEEGDTSDTYKPEQFCTSGDFVATENDGKFILTRSCSVLLPHVEPAGASKHKLSQSVPALSQWLHLTPEELASAPGIDAETCPEISFLESLPDSHSSHKSLRSSLPSSRLKPRASPQPDRMLSGQVGSNQDSEDSESPGKRSPHVTVSPRNMRTRSKDSCIKTLPTSTAKTESEKSKRHRGRNPNEVDLSRKGALPFHTPDLSKVEAKVQFPKGGYKPPKSRLPKKMESLSPKAPLVFKSPADIVKEVLLNITSEPPSPSGNVAVSTTPQDFRSRWQATSLLEQLQEDYNRLLTKYAAAENTIDRLRLEAKVNLYSDPPKAGHCVQSGLNRDALKFVKLDFGQPNRAEIDAASVSPNQHDVRQGASSPSLQLGQQLSTILFSQADKFLQQLQTFENLLQSGKLKPGDQVASLSHLADGLDSLERGYLLTRDEHKLLQQRGAEPSDFDPERELEDLIFQCGLHLDEMKEQVEQKLQEEPLCERSHSSSPSEHGQTPTLPQNPLELSLNRGETVEGESSPIAKESDEEEARFEELLDSLHLKDRCPEPDFLLPFDPDQSFKELPKLLAERVSITASLQTDFQPGSGTKETQNKVPQRRVKSDHDSSPVSTSRQRRGSPPGSSALSQPALHPRSSRKLQKGRSHSSSLSSLGDAAASERRTSKTRAASRTVLSQDGIISPETDSGFIGSESSRLTHAANHSPLQQRAPESVSVGNCVRPHSGAACTSTPSSQSRVNTAPDPPAAPRHSRTFSCSPQCWTQQTRLNAQTESEGEQSDRYTQSADSLHTSHLSSSPSPAARRRHGDPLLAPSSTPSTDCNEAFRELQAEVNVLKQRLENGLRAQPQSDPAAQLSSSRHSVRSAEQHNCVRQSRRGTFDEVDNSKIRPAAKKKSGHKHGALTRSGLTSASVQSQTLQTPHVSRSTQTPAVAAAQTHCSSRTIHRQPPVLSAHSSEAAGDSDSRSHEVPPPSRRLSHHSRSEVSVLSRPDGGDREPRRSSTPCPLCEELELQRRSEPGRRRHSAAHHTGRSTENSEALAPPAQLHWQLACTHNLLLCSSPLYLAPPSGVRAGGETRSRKKLSESVDDSLDRAIRAARHMKHTSRHMALSLQDGLQHQQLLSQSCSY